MGWRRWRPKLTRLMGGLEKVRPGDVSHDWRLELYTPVTSSYRNFNTFSIDVNIFSKGTFRLIYQITDDCQRQFFILDKPCQNLLLISGFSRMFFTYFIIFQVETLIMFLYLLYPYNSDATRTILQRGKIEIKNNQKNHLR